MMDSILILLRDTIEDTILKDERIPRKRKEWVTEVSFKAVCDSFRENLTLNNISSLSDLFSDEMAFKNNYIVNNIINSVSNDLGKKTELKDKAKEVATSIVSGIVCALWGQIHASDKGHVSLNLLIDIFSGTRDEEVVEELEEEPAGTISLVLDI